MEVKGRYIKQLFKGLKQLVKASLNVIKVELELSTNLPLKNILKLKSDSEWSNIKIASAG